MNKTKSSHTEQKGFSLIEMLLVLVIVGTLVSMAVPSLMSAREAAEDGGTIATLKAMHIDQANYFVQYGRYARIAELNSYANDSLGTTVGSTVVRGNYRFISFPSWRRTLETRYSILAIKYKNNRASIAYIIRQDGEVETLF